MFKVLQDAFLESHSSTLGLAILQSLDSIYRLDPANYFIVQEHHTLSMFLEGMVERNNEVQVKIRACLHGQSLNSESIASLFMV